MNTNSEYWGYCIYIGYDTNINITRYINVEYVSLRFVSSINCGKDNLKKSILVVACILFEININTISRRITTRAINPICSGETKLANINVVRTGISLTSASLRPKNNIFLNKTISCFVKHQHFSWFKQNNNSYLQQDNKIINSMHLLI
jgi:hypothetical protein